MGAAESIANQVVRSGLAACVNIVPGLKSVYLWKGAVEADDELLLLIKTTEARYQELEDTIREAHPYELPEIVCVPILAGLPGYLQWIQDVTSPSR
jgi:periplasmic divalent cation tolerance protein